jgi:trimeric autotransporter adhesin
VKYLCFLSFILSSNVVYSQLSGTKTIPGDYPTLAAAILALNTSGVGNGGVSFDITAGYVETFASYTAGIITATGTTSNPVIFKKNGIGVNPLITAAAGVGTRDGIIILQGSDYVTFDGIDLQDNSTNTNTNTKMEWGFAFLKKSSSSPINGCQYNTIQNCSIRLDRTNTATRGINVANQVLSSSTDLFIYSASDENSNNKFYGNSIRNCYSGIVLRGFGNNSLGDSNNDIGGTNLLTGNNILNFGGAANICTGILVEQQYDLNIQFNTIKDSADIEGASSGGTLYGVYIPEASTSCTISNNTFILTKGNNSASAYGIYSALTSGAPVNNVVISNNTFQNWTSNGGSGDINFIYQNFGVSNLSITQNTFQNNNFNTSGTIRFVYNAAASSSKSIIISSNSINNNSRLSGSGNTMVFYTAWSTGGANYTEEIKSNMIQNYSDAGNGDFTGISTRLLGMKQILIQNVVTNIQVGSGDFTGIFFADGNSDTVRNNTVEAITSSGNAVGLYELEHTGVPYVLQNTVNGLTSHGYATGISLTTNGMLYAFQNNVYNLTANGSASKSTGIAVNDGSGYSLSLHNNFISDINAPYSTNSSAVVGISITGSPANGHMPRVCYNTVYLNAVGTSSTFGSAAIYVSYNVNVSLRNNIFCNASQQGSAGYTVAYLRTGSGYYSNFSQESDNNLYYAGTPGSRNLIFYDGSSADQTIIAIRARYSPRESVSFSEIPPFINITSKPYDLHINPSLPTLLKHAARTISDSVSTTAILAAVNIDYDGQSRSSTPDVGADEFSVVFPVIWKHFSAYCNNNKTVLHWETAIEYGIAGYIVQGSENATNWFTIVFVKSASNPTGSSYDYQLNDSHYKWYRILQKDENGKELYTNILRANCANTAAAVSPNPANNDIVFSVKSGFNQKYKLDLINLSGQVLFSKTGTLQSGNNVLTIHSSVYAAGYYHLKLQLADGEATYYTVLISR